MRIGVLGPLAVDGDVAALGPRDRVVLAALVATSGHPLTPDQIADALWGDRPPASWGKVVQGCVVRLRKALGPQAVETVPQGYRLAVPPDEIDTLRFERLVGRGGELLTLGENERASYVLEQALALWRGQALADLDGWESGHIEAGRLHELRLDAEELRLDAGLRAGHHGEVLAEAQQRVAEAPVRERRWALLARAQYQAGRQAEALRTLHRVRTVLAAELGLDPGPDLVSLEQAILRQDPSLVAEVGLPEPSASCPYRGLMPYDVDDSDAFFGRDADLAACLDRLATAGVLAVVGPSGSGKSSLVRAGVTAARRRAGRRAVVVTPGAHPMDALAALPATGPVPALVVDQCEEVFSLCEDAAEAARFLTALVEHSARAELVVALRADRMGELSAHPGFARLVERGLYLLGAMTADDLRAAVEGPAQQAGLPLEPGLVDLLVRDVEGEPGALPLLSHALRETWLRREGRTLTVDGYRATGGIRGAVAQSAEQVYERVDSDQRAALRDLLLRLVAPTEDGEPIRSRLPRRLVATDPEHERLIELLVGARLVTSDDGVVELAHEALARAWPRLRGWLDDDAEGLRSLHHLTVAADSWDAMGRPDSELYRGVRLARAVDWRERADPQLTATEQAFLEASRACAQTELQAAQRRAEQEARARRRTRRLAAGLAGVLVLALLAAGLALRYQRDATARAADAERSALLADARALREAALSEERLDLALLYAAQAYRLESSSGARASLLQTVLRSPAATAVYNTDQRLQQVAVSGDGDTVAGIGSEGTVYAWDVGSRQPVATVPDVTYDGGTSLDLSPDGRRLLVVGMPVAEDPAEQVFKSQVVQVDLTRTDPVPRALAGPALSAARFADDGRTVVTLDVDGVVRYVDARSGQVEQRLGAEIAGPRTVVLGPTAVLDGSANRRYLVASDPEGSERAVAWEVDSGHVLWSSRERGGTVAAISPDGSALVLGHADGSVEQVETGPDGRRRVVRTETDGALLGVEWAPDGSTVAGTTADGTVEVWDAETLQPVTVLRGHTGNVSDLVYSRDGRSLYASGDDRSVLAWDLAGVSSIVQQVGGPLPASTVGSYLAADGSLAAAYLASGRFHLLDVPEATVTEVPIPPRGGPAAGFVDPTGRYVGIIETRWPDAATGTIRVVDAAQGELLPYTIRIAPRRGFDAAISGDGRTLVVAVDRRVVLRDVRTGRLLRSVGAYQASTGGSYVAADEDGLTAALNLRGGGIEIADLSSGQRVTTLDTSPTGATLGQAGPLRFSPDGRWLAAGSAGGRVAVWDTASWQLHDSWVAVPSGSVSSLVFTPDSQFLVSGGGGVASVWDVEQGGYGGATLDVEPGADVAVATRDGSDTVVTLSNGTGVRLWDVAPEALLEHACRVAGRSLTEEEWAAVLPDRPHEPTCPQQLAG